MKLIVGMLLLFAVAAHPLSAQARGSVATFPWSSHQHQNDEEAIRKLVADSTAAWNTGDATAYAAHFSSHGSITTMDGMVLEGRKPLMERQDKLFRTIFRGSRLKQTISKLRFLARDVAILEIDSELTGFAGLPPGVQAWPDGVLRTRVQQVMVMVGGSWWIEGHHCVDLKGPPSRG